MGWRYRQEQMGMLRLVGLLKMFWRHLQLLSVSQSSCHQVLPDCITQLEPQNPQESYRCHYFLVATSSQSVGFRQPLHTHQLTCEYTALRQALKSLRVAANHLDRLKSSLRRRSNRRESNPLPSTLVQVTNIDHSAVDVYMRPDRRSNFPTALRNHTFHRHRGYSK